MTTSSYTATKAKQSRIKDALVAYLGAHSRLPCPDDPGTGGITGTEDPVGGPCPAGSFGVVPWVTLGLGRDVAEDDWGNFFSYQVYAGASASCPGTGIDWTDSDCFGEGKSGSIVIDGGSVAVPDPSPTTSVIVALVSHGPNGLGAWTRQVTRNASPTTCEESHNALISTCTLTAYRFYSGERTENDDVVAYLTATETINRLAKQGDILSATARVNYDLQTLYDQAVARKASVGCSGTSSLTLPNDPWGTPYTVTPPNLVSFPITICSGATCRTLDSTTYNGYMTKSGLPICP
jgi:hypothetical protein